MNEFETARPRGRVGRVAVGAAAVLAVAVGLFMAASSPRARVMSLLHPAMEVEDGLFDQIYVVGR